MYIYNTMTRKKELFVPLKEGQVSMYACGPTVYNFFHIGNARPFIVFDTLTGATRSPSSRTSPTSTTR